MNINEPRFPVYIVSKGRYNRRPTASMFERLGIPYNIIVEEPEASNYQAVVKGQVLILPPRYRAEYDTFWHDGDARTGPGPARNFAWDHAISNGASWHWVFDDNIDSIERYNHNMKIPCSNGSAMWIMEDFVLRFDNIAQAGPGYACFCKATDAPPPLRWNTRIYSALLIRNDIPFRWRGRYNEDTDLSIRCLKAGWSTLEFNVFLQGKMTTQRLKGGNLKEFYAQEGTMNKSRMLVEMHPDVSRMTRRFNRDHHVVDYGPFKSNDPKPNSLFYSYTGTIEYGMQLKRKEKV